MTDKEQLEIIKFLRNSEKTVAPGMQPSELISRKDVDWLINRVEELELEINDWREEVQKWQQFYKESEESHLETKELLHSTISEIKRYKRALEEISNADWNSEGLDAEWELDRATDIAIKALEGEK